MAEKQENELHRLTHDEYLIVKNYRLLKCLQQEILLDFSCQLVKQNPSKAIGNVIALTGRKITAA